MSDNQNLEQKFFQPFDCYLDSPFEETGLSALFNSTDIKLKKIKHSILKDYSEIAGFTGFARAIGVMTGLEIRRYKATEMQQKTFPVMGRETSTTIDNDFFINGSYWSNKPSQYFLGSIDLNSKIVALSFAVWQTLCKAGNENLTAFYRPNDSNSHLDKRSNSFLVTQLRSSEWIPDKNNEFHKPQDITAQNLHPQFQCDNRNGWLTAIGFGEGEKKRSEEYKVRNQKAQDLGFESVEEIEKLRKIKESGINIDEALASAQPAEQPEVPVPNPERRRKGILERKENAPSKQSVSRERKIQPNLHGSIVKAKAYLRANYTNESGETVCQCCQRIMPFKIGTDYYFEAVQCIKELDKLYFENRLALCPTCTAKYQHIRETKDEQLRELISNADAESESFVEIPIMLGQKEYSIRFVAKHWFDLKIILEDIVLSR